MRMRVAYTTFEHTVIGLYNKQALTVDLLDTLALMYNGMEVDSAGSVNLRANDGRDLPQVCIALVDPTFALIENGARSDDGDYWDIELNKWSHITKARWGWC